MYIWKIVVNPQGCIWKCTVKISAPAVAALARTVEEAIYSLQEVFASANIYEHRRSATNVTKFRLLVSAHKRDCSRYVARTYSKVFFLHSQQYVQLYSVTRVGEKRCANPFHERVILEKFLYLELRMMWKCF